MKAALVDRLSLDGKRIDDMIAGVETVASLDDPIGKVKAGWRTPAGLFIEQTTVPLGVVAIIYESRPNVTVDAFSLAYKAGCAILLRGSKAAVESNRALVQAIKRGLSGSESGDDSVVELAPCESHDEIDAILNARGFIDAVLPRGGHELIRHVVENARVPVIETGEGNCHIYVEPSACDTDEGLEKTLAIIDNAKTQKPGACNAVETLLVRRDAAERLLPALVARFSGRVELRCDKAALLLCEGAKPASPSDWSTEYLDYILAVKTVASLDEAVAHINRYGTRHSEAILTRDLEAAEKFCAEVDAACVYINASTRFTDGGEFGFGAELGISTQKFHARGPMGLDALTTIKYRVRGDWLVRK
jgi:glutamate-5-semialdehyde dehydrogenase